MLLCINPDIVLCSEDKELNQYKINVEDRYYILNGAAYFLLNNATGKSIQELFELLIASIHVKDELKSQEIYQDVSLCIDDFLQKGLLFYDNLAI